MTNQPLRAVMRHLSRIVTHPPDGEESDPQLLRRFTNHHDEAAFTALVHRHGPMVRGACRRLLRQEADADDAFQATFLVLLRKARSIRKRQSVASWLYGVAFRIASRIRAEPPRRRYSEHHVAVSGDPGLQAAWRELCTVLDAEVQGLPEKYRAPLVLCYLEGQTRDQAVNQLGWSLRTLDRRLGRGRELLRMRLIRRGLSLPAGLLVTALSQRTAGASLPIRLIESLVRTATAWSAGKVGTGGGTSAKVAAMAEGALKAIALAKLKSLIAIVLAVSLVALGAGILPWPAMPAKLQDGTQADQLLPAREAALPAPAEEKHTRTDRLGDPLPPGAIARIGTQRFWHEGNFSTLVYAPDGKTLASAASDSTIRLWEAATGKELRTFHEPNEWVSCLAFSPDGRTLASGAYRVSVIRLWDVATGKELRHLPGHESGTEAIAFSRDGKMLAAATGEHIIRLWDTASWQEVRQLTAHTSKVHSIAFLPDGRGLVSGSQDNTVRLWDSITGREIRRLNLKLEDRDFLTRTVLSPDGKTLATFDTGGMLHLWETATGKKVSRLILGGPSGWSLAFSPDGQVLACRNSGRNQQVRFFAAATGLELRRWDDEERFMLLDCLAFSPHGKVLAQAGMAMIQLRDSETGKPAVRVPRLPERVMTVRFASNGKSLVTGLWGGSSGIWDAFTGKPRSSMRGPPASFAGPMDVVVPTSLTADGKTAALTDRQGAIHIWETATGKELRQIADPPSDWSHLLSPDGKFLASRHQDKIVRLWDTATGQFVRPMRAPNDYVYPRVFSADGNKLAAVSSNRMIYVWDRATGNELRRLSWQGNTVAVCLAFCPDGKLLLSGHSLGKPIPGEEQREPLLRLWDLSKGRELRQLHVAGEVSAIAISPDGKTFAAGIGNAAIQLWEIASSKERGRYKGHRSGVASLAFSPDGRLLASGGNDHTAMVWDLTGILKEGQLPGLNLPAKEINHLWEDLASADGARAYRAIWHLAAAAPQSVPLLAERVRPAARDEEDRITRLIAELDSRNFGARDKATAELDRLGELAGRALEKTLAGNPSAEVRRRIESLLSKPTAPLTSPEMLRRLRAVEVLEQAATAKSRQLLQSLAKGAPGARLTQDAKAVLQRLTRHPAATP